MGIIGNCPKKIIQMISDVIIRLSLVVGLMLVVPLVCRKIHVPSIVGFILAGMAIGPMGWNLIGESATIASLGKIGMLYIIFQSGVEIDMNDFTVYRQKSILFGLLSFVFPFGLGLVTSRYLLGYEWTTSVLLGAMYGSHTLMTYPIVSRYSIQKNAAVNITVGGTMVAITLSLLGLALIEAAQIGGGPGWEENAVAMAKIGLFVIAVAWGMPRAAQWFLKRIQEPIADYTMAMTLLLISAALAEMAGLDSILGAFICGVALNGQIPNRSPLMRNINLVGSSIFVPMFLFGVGMMMDVRVFFSGWTVLTIAGVMIVTKLTGKWLAAGVTQWVCHLSGMERELIFGMSHATAAGTLAVATVGYSMGILSPEILNGTIIMILILCTISSFVTEHAAKQIALEEEAQMESDRDEDKWTLISVGEEIGRQLHEIAVLSELKEPDYLAAEDWDEVRDHVAHHRDSTIIYHPLQPIATISRILVAVPRHAEKEKDFISCFGQIRRLSSQTGAKVVFFANEDSEQAIKALCHRPGKYLRASYREMPDWEDVLMMAKEVEEDDLVVMISARPSTVSYNPLFRNIPDMLERFFSKNSYVVLYPIQGVGSRNGDHILMDLPQTSEAWSMISAIKQWILKQMRKLQ